MDINNNTTLFALFYYTTTGDKSTNIISFDKESLLDLKKKSYNGEDSFLNRYKKYILKMEVEPITVYNYENNSIFKIEDLQHLNSGNYYASYDYYFHNTKNSHINSLKEVLVYLSDEDHQKWRECYEDKKVVNLNREIPFFFYDTPISLNPVNPDEFFEEGIMNA